MTQGFLRSALFDVAESFPPLVSIETMIQRSAELRKMFWNGIPTEEERLAAKVSEEFVLQLRVSVSKDTPRGVTGAKINLMRSLRRKWRLVCAGLFAGLAALHLTTRLFGVNTATTLTNTYGIGRTDFHIEGARVVAPGIIRVDFQIGREAFNCSGGADYYLWFFGITKRIRWTRWDS